MFQVQNITTSELSEIIHRIDDTLAYVDLTVDDFNISRIDYSFNTVEKDDDVRWCLFDLLNEKAPTHRDYLFLLKRTYPTSFRRTTPKDISRTVSVYDKNEERMSKNTICQKFERDIIRSEMQVKREHIKHRVKTQPITRRLSDWLTVEQYQHFISKLWHFVFKGDFYTLSAAKAIVMGSNYSPVIKRRLAGFLEDIAATDMDTASQKYSLNTYKSYITRLDELGVNPMTLPDNGAVQYISSPFKFFSIC